MSGHICDDTCVRCEDCYDETGEWVCTVVCEEMGYGGYDPYDDDDAYDPDDDTFI